MMHTCKIHPDAHNSRLGVNSFSHQQKPFFFFFFFFTSPASMSTCWIQALHPLQLTPPDRFRATESNAYTLCWVKQTSVEGKDCVSAGNWFLFHLPPKGRYALLVVPDSTSILV